MDIKDLPQPKSKDFKLHEITTINHKPHPYCITPKHLLPDEMYLNEQTITEAEKQGATCGMYYNPQNPKEYANHLKNGFVRCDLPYNEHTSDKVLFIKALVNKEIKDLTGLQKYLLSIQPILEKNKIDGVAFIKN